MPLDIVHRTASRNCNANVAASPSTREPVAGDASVPTLAVWRQRGPRKPLMALRYKSTLAFGNAPNRPYDSKRYKANLRDSYPSRFSVPLDLLGRGHRWPDAPKLDSETRDKILWREIGRAP